MFNLHDEIDTCMIFVVRVELRDKVPFFLYLYALKEEQNVVVEKGKIGYKC